MSQMEKQYEASQAAYKAADALSAALLATTHAGARVTLCINAGRDVHRIEFQCGDSVNLDIVAPIAPGEVG